MCACVLFVYYYSDTIICDHRSAKYIFVRTQAIHYTTAGYFFFLSIFFFFANDCGAVAERLRHRFREQRVPSSSPAWTSVLRQENFLG